MTGTNPTNRELLDKARCETCRFFRAFELLPVPPEPETHVRFLGIDWKRDRYVRMEERYLRRAAISNNNSGLCHRMPEALTKRKTDWCGEHLTTSLKDTNDG